MRLKSRGWAKKKSGKLVDDAGVCRRVTTQTPMLALLHLSAPQASPAQPTSIGTSIGSPKMQDQEAPLSSSTITQRSTRDRLR